MAEHDAPPPPPPAPPTEPPPPGSISTSGVTKGEGLKNYNRVTDKLAGPSIRISDNVASLIGTVVGALIGVAVGYFMAGNSHPKDVWIPLLIGGIAGAFVGLILVGFVLMIVGLARR